MQRSLRFFYTLYVTVLVVQGIHVVEHIIKLAQVYLFGVPDDDALGLLGYVFQFQGTEEWLHLLFNMSYMYALWILMLLMRDLTGRQVPRWAFLTFAVGGVALESWHVVEHFVIITNVIRHDGCPCPGIGDRALGLSDTVLHFIYNSIAFTATVIPFRYLKRSEPVMPLGPRSEGAHP